MERPSEVLPTPGGPTKHRIGPFMSGFSRRTREVVEDAILHLLQAVVVLVEDLLRLQDVHLARAVFAHGSTASHST